VLLVTAVGVPDATLVELARRRPDHVIVVGGTAAIPESVARAVRAESRIAGRDRYETSRLLAGGRTDAYLADGRAFARAAPVAAAAVGAGVPLLLVDHSTPPPPSRASAEAVVLASTWSFADALTAAALGEPLFLVPRTCVPDAIRVELERLDPQRLTLVGGTAALGDGVGELRSCSLPDTVTYEFGGEVTVAQRAYVRAGVDASRRRWGDPGPMVVQAFTDLDDMVAANVRARGWTEDEWREWWDDGHASALGSAGWIGINLASTLAYFDTTSRAMRVVAHEVGHALEYQWGDVDVPEWLLEGGAEWLAVETVEAAGWSDHDVRGEFLDRAQRWGRPLTDFETEQPDAGEYSMGWAGCQYLAELAGPDALLDLFRTVAGGATWQSALHDETGLGPEAFYEGFARWL
jgi:hypothetical protein